MATTTRARPASYVHAHSPATALGGWRMNRLSMIVAAILVVLGPLVLANFHASIFIDPFYLLGPGLGLVLAIVLAFHERAWLYLTAGIVVAIVPLMFLVMWIWQALFAPLFPAEFIGGWMITLGAFLALWAGIRGFRQFRHNDGARIRRGWGTADGLVLVLPLLFVLGGVSAASLAAQQASSIEVNGVDFVPAATVNVALHDYEFAPGTINVQRGVVTQIVVENQDNTFHTFTYRNGGQEYNHDILAGQTVSFLVRFDTAGTFAVRCIPHSDGYDDGMVAEIVVTG